MVCIFSPKRQKVGRIYQDNPLRQHIMVVGQEQFQGESWAVKIDLIKYSVTPLKLSLVKAGRIERLVEADLGFPGQGEIEEIGFQGKVP